MANRVSLRIEHKDPTGGLNAKGRAYLNAKTGSNLQAPVTKKVVFPLDKKQEGNLFVQECLSQKDH